LKILTVDFARFETEYVAVVEIRKVSWLFRKISSRLEKFDIYGALPIGERPFQPALKKFRMRKNKIGLNLKKILLQGLF
jgi:hypothetical protein